MHMQLPTSSKLLQELGAHRAAPLVDSELLGIDLLVDALHELHDEVHQPCAHHLFAVHVRHQEGHVVALRSGPAASPAFS
eukprot:scaffold1903_cov396-Prasinococcus_capsulatus_cf.AAC.9